MLLRFVHIVARINILFFSLLSCSPLCEYRQFVYSLIDGHMSCLQSLANMDNDTMNITVSIFMWTYVWISLGEIPRSVTAGLYGEHVFNCTKYCYIAFQSGYGILHSHQQHRNAPVAPHPLQHLILSVALHFSHSKGYSVFHVLVTTDARCLFVCLWPLMYLLLWVPVNLLPIFLKFSCYSPFFHLKNCSSFFNMLNSVLYQIYVLRIFFCKLCDF